VTPHDTILRPVVSEKAVSTIEDGKYAFFVHPKASRTQVKDAVERVFGVDVLKINILNVRGKVKRMGRFQGTRPARKKAIVTLKPGQRIEELEGLS
jgi:large subunit ribosomal protein L23